MDVLMLVAGLCGVEMADFVKKILLRHAVFFGRQRKTTAPIAFGQTKWRVKRRHAVFFGRHPL